MAKGKMARGTFAIDIQTFFNNKLLFGIDFAYLPICPLPFETLWGCPITKLKKAAEFSVPVLTHTAAFLVHLLAAWNRDIEYFNLHIP